MRFKFFLYPTTSPLEAKYQFPCVILAQGFQEMGIPFGGNINYWFAQGATDYTIKATMDDAPVHIYDWFYFRYTPDAWGHIDKSKINVLIDYSDGFITHAMSKMADKFDVVLRAHYTTHLPYPKHVHSWPFALSNRIIDAVNATRNQEILPRAIMTYRVHLDVRRLTNEGFVPFLSKKYPLLHFESATPGPEITENEHTYWWQTGRRHDELYFAELNKSLFSLAFGGILVPKPYPSNTAKNLQYLANRALLKFIPGLRAKGYLQYIIQYDSWRLWESFISDACPLFLNFEQWGFQLPVNPIAGEHYLDVDLKNMEKSAKRIVSMPTDEIKHISQNGREWAFKHYAPLPVTHRFLNLVDAVKR